MMESAENNETEADSAATDIAAAEQRWREFRSPENPSHRTLVPFTIKWLLRLPVQLRPLLLASQYPRIANMLAVAWTMPVQRQTMLADLMWDKRGTRQGFPQPIYRELQALYALGQQRETQAGTSDEMPDTQQMAAGGMVR